MLTSYTENRQKKQGNEYIVKDFVVGGRTMLQKGDYPYVKGQT